MPDLFNIDTIIWVLQAGLLAWLGGLFLYVVFKMLTGGIRTNGLLTHHPAGTQGFAERAALLAATLGYAFYYSSTALNTPLDAIDPSLPDVPESILTVLFGMNGLYLTSKIADLRKKGP